MIFVLFSIYYCTSSFKRNRIVFKNGNTTATKDRKQTKKIIKPFSSFIACIMIFSDQLTVVRRFALSTLICLTGDNIQTMQRNAFLQINPGWVEHNHNEFGVSSASTFLPRYRLSVAGKRDRARTINETSKRRSRSNTRTESRTFVFSCPLLVRRCCRKRTYDISRAPVSLSRRNALIPCRQILAELDLSPWRFNS